MTTASVENVMLRIRDAEPDSRISVFRCKVNGQHCIEALFTNTVRVQQRLYNGDNNYIGTFHKGSPQEMVRNMLNKAVRKRVRRV